MGLVRGVEKLERIERELFRRLEEEEGGRGSLVREEEEGGGREEEDEEGKEGVEGGGARRRMPGKGSSLFESSSSSLSLSLLALSLSRWEGRWLTRRRCLTILLLWGLVLWLWVGLVKMKIRMKVMKIIRKKKWHLRKSKNKFFCFCVKNINFPIITTAPNFPKRKKKRKKRN